MIGDWAGELVVALVVGLVGTIAAGVTRWRGAKRAKKRADLATAPPPDDDAIDDLLR